MQLFAILRWWARVCVKTPSKMQGVVSKQVSSVSQITVFCDRGLTAPGTPGSPKLPYRVSGLGSGLAATGDRILGGPNALSAIWLVMEICLDTTPNRFSAISARGRPPPSPAHQEGHKECKTVSPEWPNQLPHSLPAQSARAENQLSLEMCFDTAPLKGGHIQKGSGLPLKTSRRAQSRIRLHGHAGCRSSGSSSDIDGGAL
jgi:hypothetical protein